MLEGGRMLVGGASFLFPTTKDRWAFISGLSVDTAPQNEQPAGWINGEEKQQSQSKKKIPQVEITSTTFCLTEENGQTPPARTITNNMKHQG